MKKLFCVFALLLVSLASYSQPDAYKTAMRQALTDLRAANSFSQMELALNQFDQMAATQTTEWLPAYYAAYTAVQISFRQKEIQPDLYLDKAQQYLDKAHKIKPNESEIYALQAFLYQGRLQVAPMERGPQYVGLIQATLAKAKELNPENPRVYYLMGQQDYYTPAVFGGGPAVALPALMQAEAKFASFKPQNDLAPDWGKEAVQYLLEQIKQSTTGK